MPQSTEPIVTAAVAVIARVRERSPRVQCLTNTVAQQITANVLLAIGARVSMATHADEVVDMTASADALLINLGTLDAARIEAIPRLLADHRVRNMPRVLDPVFVEHSAQRRRLAHQVIGMPGPLIVKGNAAEVAALDLLGGKVRVRTGATDLVTDDHHGIEIANGHPWMADVTGLGCALGAVIAACMAVEPNPVTAATAAVLAFGVAAEVAAASASGPGSFAVGFIDAISRLDAATVHDFARVARVKQMPQHD